MGWELVPEGRDALAGHLMILAAALLLDLGGTLITLRPPSDPAALAEVYFENHNVNGPQHNGVYPLAADDLLVEVEFEWEVGMDGEDRVTVIPPDGVVCIPENCTAIVREEYDGIIVLYEWNGM